MENPIKMDDLGGKPPIFGNIQMGVFSPDTSDPCTTQSSWPLKSSRSFFQQRTSPAVPATWLDKMVHPCPSQQDRNIKRKGRFLHYTKKEKDVLKAKHQKYAASI